MTVRISQLLITLLAITPLPALAQEKLYLIVYDRIVLIFYHSADELAGLWQRIDQDDNVNTTYARPEEDGKCQSYSSLRSFLTDYDNGVLSWGSPSGFLHNNLNSLSPIPPPDPEPFIAHSLPLVCLNYFYHGECDFHHCSMIHLTPGQKEVMLQRPNAGIEDEEINPTICIRFSRGECDDDNCPNLHIRFDPNRRWRSRDQ